MTEGNPPPTPLASRTLYRAQRMADRPSALFFVLLGLASAARQALHKAVRACEPASAASAAHPGKEAPPPESAAATDVPLPASTGLRPERSSPMEERMQAPDAACVDAVLCCTVQGGTELVKTLLKMFYQEGRAFSRTRESLCWQVYLRDLEVFKAASILWSISNMDSFVLNGRDPEMKVDNFLAF
jgi:hypothetical protein